MRLNALRWPPSSHTAMHIGVEISVAFASAAAMIRCAASVVMLAVVNVVMDRKRSSRSPTPSRIVPRGAGALDPGDLEPHDLWRPLLTPPPERKVDAVACPPHG